MSRPPSWSEEAWIIWRELYERGQLAGPLVEIIESLRYPDGSPLPDTAVAFLLDVLRQRCRPAKRNSGLIPPALIRQHYRTVIDDIMAERLTPTRRTRLRGEPNSDRERAIQIVADRLGVSERTVIAALYRKKS